MANANSLTIGKTTLQVANTLASLDDTNISGTPAEGSVLTMQSGKWAANTVEGAIGGRPVLTGLNAASASVGDDGSGNLQLTAAFSDGSQRAANFTHNGIVTYTAQAGQGWQLTAVVSADADTGWQFYTSDYFDFMYRKKNGIVSIVCNGQIKQNVSSDTLQLNVAMPDGYRPDIYYIPAVFSVRYSKQAMCVFFGQDGSVWADINGAQAGQIISGSLVYHAA